MVKEQITIVTTDLLTDSKANQYLSDQAIM